MTTANVVFSGGAKHFPFKVEGKVATGETIVPGHLVLIDSDGELSNHDSEGQGGNYFVADMNTFEQKSVSDNLTVGQSSEAFSPTPGEYYNLVLADGETAVVGSPLTSNGDGTVKVAATDGTEQVLAYADEALSPSGSTGRIRARVAAAGFANTTT